MLRSYHYRFHSPYLSFTTWEFGKATILDKFYFKGGIRFDLKSSLYNIAHNLTQDNYWITAWNYDYIYIQHTGNLSQKNG